jgi:isohexenylglutaconyl-CoA hydratase
MTSLPVTSALTTDRRGPFLFVTLDEPATRNALSTAMVADLSAVLDATRDDRSLRALILQGTGGRFCAGGNLKGGIAAVAVQGDAVPDPVLEESRRGGRLFHALDRHPMAVIALVDGPAMGGGMGIACCADIVIATDRARFALSETRLGLAPAQIAPFVVRRIGLQKARRFALSGSPISGAQALDLGLTDFHCPSLEEAEAVLKTVLQDIRQCAPEANAKTKAFLQDCEVRAEEAAVEAAAQLFIACLRSAEGTEGVAAFGKKRPAKWAEQG